MRNKKVILLSILFSVTILMSACSRAEYTDGVYTSELSEFAASGWKDTVEITIENGSLIKINWDAIYKDETIPIRKKQYSKSGLYGMLKAGAVGEWYDQAVAAEQYVLENGLDALSVKDDGYTDAVSGCTVHVSDFDKLLRECLELAKN